MRRVGVLTGLASETQLIERAAAGGSPPLLACSGADSARARRAASRLIAGGAEALLSFGLAGGLNARLRPGHLILPDSVILPGGRAVPVEPAWIASLRALAQGGGLPFDAGAIAGSDRVLATAAEKRALAEETGAAGVDMESHALAEAAETAGLPILVLRAVADPANRALPRAALGAVRADGRPDLPKILKRLLFSPWEGTALLRLRIDGGAALAALDRLLRLAGPALFAPRGGSAP